MSDRDLSAEVGRLERALATSENREAELRKRNADWQAHVAELESEQAAAARLRAEEREHAERLRANETEAERVAAAPAAFRARVEEVVNYGIARDCFAAAVDVALDARLFGANARAALSGMSPVSMEGMLSRLPDAARMGAGTKFAPFFGHASSKPSNDIGVAIDPKIFASYVPANLSTAVGQAEEAEAIRLKTILRSPLAIGRESYAASLAFSTEIAAETAVALLAAVPTAKRPMSIAERAAELPELWSAGPPTGFSDAGAASGLRRAVDTLNMKSKKD